LTWDVIVDIPAIFLIALALSMDAFAVAIAGGVVNQSKKYVMALKFGLSFGFFQMIMPIIGWSLGFGAREWIAHVDHWIAFILLSAVGGKMIYEGLQMETLERRVPALTLSVLLGLSLATSLDALAAGLSFACLGVEIIAPALIIGSVTFAVSVGGFLIGNTFGHIFEKRIELAGGILLIFIGMKILMEHLLF